ncbi:MAG: CRISPR-associated helicase Cas3', partial [Halanaerobiales bacterium]
MNNPFLAKTIPRRETIIEHTSNLLNEYNNLKGINPGIKNINWEILKLACLYHDLGKMNIMFQKKLLGHLKEKDDLDDTIYKTLNIREIPHGFLSPAFLPKIRLREKYSKDEMRILYQSIYYHHARKKPYNSNDLKTIIKEDLERYIYDFKYDEIGKIENLYHSYNKYIKRRIPDPNDSSKIYYQYVMTKGLLNKIDYAASCGVVIEEKNEDLFDKTQTYFNKMGYNLNELQKYMIKHQDENNIIVASTGIGKTEAALFWISNNKGFFTLPLKVSINAIYDRVIDNKTIGFNKSKTALLHSDTMSEYLKRGINKSKNDSIEDFDLEYYDKTKQLSLPLTICTLDQLIDFIFKYEGFELKLATLSYSKLIIDEIQMYSPDLIAYLIVALKYITEIGGKFSILTATLPNIFVDFMRNEGINFNIPKKPFLKKNKNGNIQLRHRVNVFEESINIDHVLENYQNKKVLIIVNTVKKA